MTCQSDVCEGYVECAHLSVARDGTVSVTMRRKLNASEQQRLRRTGTMLAIVDDEGAVEGMDWLFGAMKPSDIRYESQSFRWVWDTIETRGEKLARWLLDNAFSHLYGRYSILDWSGNASIAKQVKKFTTAPKGLKGESAKVWTEFVGHVRKAAALARRAAKSGRPEDAADMMNCVRRAFRSRIQFERLRPRKPESLVEPEPDELDELDADIRRAERSRRVA